MARKQAHPELKFQHLTYLKQNVILKAKKQTPANSNRIDL